jgi:hypothetical protein
MRNDGAHSSCGHHAPPNDALVMSNKPLFFMLSENEEEEEKEKKENYKGIGDDHACLVLTHSD